MGDAGKKRTSVFASTHAAETGNSSRMARSKNEASVQSSAGFEVPVRLPPEGVPRYQGVMAQYAMNLKDKWR